MPSATFLSCRSTSELSEHRHAVVPISDTLSQTNLSPSIDLANSEDVLRGVVHADFDRISRQLVRDERKKLCSESRLAMPLLAGEADVGNLLLRSRKPATTREVLLFGPEVRSECNGIRRSELLLVKVKASTNRHDATESRTQFRAV